MLRIESEISPLLLLLPVIALLAGCGGSEGELVVLKRREPRTLLTQGTALTEAETARRIAEQKQTQNQTKTNQKMLKALARLQSAKDVDSLLSALVRFRRLGAAAARHYDKVAVYLKHKDPDVRATALETLCAMDTTAAYRSHQDALKDESPLVRQQAVILWGKYHADNLAPLLVLLRDDNGRVQYEVLKALATGNPDVAVLKGVAKSVEDMDGSSAKAALSLLLPHRQEVSEFDEMVEMLLDHQDETTRLKTSEDLRKAKVLNQRLAAKAIQTVIEDPSEAVRQSCYQWLKELTSKPVPQFDPGADDDERSKSYDEFSAYLKSLEGSWGK